MILHAELLERKRPEGTHKKLRYRDVCKLPARNCSISNESWKELAEDHVTLRALLFRSSKVTHYNGVQLVLRIHVAFKCDLSWLDSCLPQDFCSCGRPFFLTFILLSINFTSFSHISTFLFRCVCVCLCVCVCFPHIFKHPAQG